MWQRLSHAEGRWGAEWSLTALAAVQRLELALANFADTMCAQVQVRRRTAPAPSNLGATWGSTACGLWCTLTCLCLTRLPTPPRTRTPHSQPHAEAFGRSCKIDPAFITNFGEEVVRGQPVFVLSGLLSDLERALRSAAGAGSWQVCLAAYWLLCVLAGFETA
jgi:hypothetical protein